MKNIDKTILAFILLILSSCSGLLDIEVEGQISGDVLKDTPSIEQALIGAYYSFGGISNQDEGGELFGGDFMVIPTLLAHANSLEIFWSSVQAPPYANFLDKNILSTNLRVAANWKRAYEVINMVNSILANIEKVDNATDKARIQGEAMAMRGILYFEMVRLWAPQYDANGIIPTSHEAIPLLTSPILDVNEIQTPTLSTIEQVYNQAETDLTQASTLLLPFGKNSTRLSYYACQAYLSRLSLQKNDYPAALVYSDKVISSAEFALAASPQAAFHNTANSPEDIFAIQQTLANHTGDRTTGTGITTFYSSLTESGLGVFAVLKSSLSSTSLINSPRFSQQDLRASIDTMVTNNATSTQITTAFYRNLANNYNELLSPAKYVRTDHVLPIIRLAEMYLVRAEAEYETNGLSQKALDDLNQVRTRAGLTPVLLTDFTNPALFFDSLAIERTRELLYEGQLLHDLKRWGGYVGTTFNPADPWDNKFILPLPQSERDAWQSGG
ncbi:MAG: RagB/SusD family nutrient uptake outer membrane protein [Cyclobacteriaceae bacterium]|nr:RagB/SusD family nutrient uptake outer membrane protein [Cyclobacteriaceae bacterium]